MLRSRHLSRTLALGFLALALLLLAACNQKAAQSTFDTAGPVARMQLDLLIIILAVAAFVLVVVEGVLLFTVIRFRRRARQQGMPSQVHGSTRMEVAWTLAPALVLLVIAVPTVRTQFAVSNPENPPELEVRVVGHQWWWEFQYPAQGFTTANELHIPVGKVVRLTLEAEDVIHSFWVPNLAGKMDLIPNRVNDMWLKADEAGVYRGQCAEFCGVQHARMRFNVMAQSPEDFSAWVQSQQAVPPPPAGAAAKGATLFSQRGCVACHTIEGTTAQGKVGPNLTHVGSRTTLAAGTLENDPMGDSLARWLRDPQAVKHGSKMPNLGLSDEDVTALVAYLESLR